MALRPKLEFFRFQLNHNDVRFKTFRDFAREVLYQRRINSDTQIMHKYLDYVRNSLVTKDAQDDSIKKQLKLISSAANIYAAYMPTVDPANHLIYGVINGGRFGRHGLMSDSDVTATDAKAFGKDKTILRYYYFLLYLPLDHNEGFLAIHSNSREETVTDVMKTFVRRLFKGNGYISPKLHPFCPRAVREEFKNESFLKELVFRDTVIDRIFTAEGMHSQDQAFDVEVKIRPRGKDYRPDDGIVAKIMNKFGFKRPAGTDSLGTFRSKIARVNNVVNESERTFTINRESMDDIIPVVYLEGRIKKYNDDQTPDFGELDKYCRETFANSILPELRPDLFPKQD